MPGSIHHHTPPLPAFAWPGGYPLVYFAGKNWQPLCAKCATESKHLSLDPSVAEWERLDVLTIQGVDVHWEGDPLICEECNEPIESAYGPTEET